MNNKYSHNAPKVTNVEIVDRPVEPVDRSLAVIESILPQRWGDRRSQVPDFPVDGCAAHSGRRWIQHGVSVGGQKQLCLGCALSGAKFTPGNHQAGSDGTLDRILQGKLIPIRMGDIFDEVEKLRRSGVGYVHWHARNPRTSEQSCDINLYQYFGCTLREHFPGLLISYGASRNGPEIMKAIARDGEWVRIQPAALARHEGGADFVTSHAAAELSIIVDLERQGYIRTEGGFKVLKPLDDYIASRLDEPLSIEANSTKGGGNYGSSCADAQLRVLARAIAERNRLNLPQEIEFTQLQRSYALTRILLDYLKPDLGSTGRLNVTILFGFSPKLPFPTTYAEFRQAVKLVRSLQQRASFPQLHLSISVGAAVLPQRARELTLPLDVGPYRGVRVPPLERLIAYSCQPDSDVDLFRCGLEDHPFLLADDGTILEASNPDLAEYTVDKIERHGGIIVNDPIALRHFAATEGRPYCEPGA